MTINKNSVEQINVALLDMDKKIKSAISNGASASDFKNLEASVDSIKRTLDEAKTGLEPGKTYNINISGNAATATKATTATIAEKANKLVNDLIVNGKTYNGSTAVDAGVQTVANGGTGVTTQADINKAFIGNLDTGESDVTDGTEFVSSYASDNGFSGPGHVNTPFRRKFSAVWNYIKSKISSNLVLANSKGVTLSSYGNEPLSIGSSSANLNLGIDSNEIQARNNGSASLLYLNYYGGGVQIGGDGITGGKLTIQGNAVGSNSYTDANPKLEFKNDDGNQNISLTFTDADAVQAPASLTLNGNQGNEYFIAPNIKATGNFYGNLSGKASTAGTADKIEPNYTSKELTTVTSKTTKYIKLADCHWSDAGTLQVYLRGDCFEDTLVINFGGGNSTSPMLCGHYSGNSHRVYSVITQKGPAWNSDYSIYVKIGQETNLTMNVALLKGSCTISISESTTAPTNIVEWNVDYGLFGNITSPNITSLEQRVAALESRI